jgi:hypothetical protein
MAAVELAAPEVEAERRVDKVDDEARPPADANTRAGWKDVTAEAGRRRARARSLAAAAKAMATIMVSRILWISRVKHLSYPSRFALTSAGRS